MSFKELHVNIKIRIIVGFFQRIINQMIIPFMTLYFADKFGVTSAGLLVLLMILLGLFVSFYAGYISDIKGRRPLLLTSEFGKFLMFFLMALVNSPWYTSAILTYILFVINHILSNLSKPALEAMIIDVSTPRTRKYIYSINYWSNNLSFAIGAMIGAFFYTKYFFQVLLFASIFTLLIFLIYIFFIKESKPEMNQKLSVEPHYKIRRIFLSYKYVIKDRVFLLFFVVAVIIATIEYQLLYFISIRLMNEFKEVNLFEEIGFTLTITGVEMYGILRAENTILVVIFAFFIEKFLKKLPDNLRLYIGTIIFTLGYSILGSSNLFWVLVIAMLILTIGELVFIPIHQTILSIIIDENQRSKYMAIYTLNERIGMMAASLFISIGALVPSFIVSIIYLILGLVALSFYRIILNNKRYIDNKGDISA